jgi:hypothetical protein
MPTRLGRRADGRFVKERYCDSCQMLGINGMACHETGCPDAWRDCAVDCFECGCAFQPTESRWQKVCPDCIQDREGGEP